MGNGRQLVAIVPKPAVRNAATGACRIAGICGTDMLTQPKAPSEQRAGAIVPDGSEPRAGPLTQFLVRYRLSIEFERKGRLRAVLAVLDGLKTIWNR